MKKLKRFLSSIFMTIGMVTTMYFGNSTTYGMLPRVQRDAAVKRKSETAIVASPAYDFSFKKLFYKKKNLINFLNSLFYPDAGENDLKIRELTYNSEASIPGKKYKHIYFDISCTCTAYAIIKTRSARGPGEMFKFDVEMQRKGMEEYYKRSVFYGARLFSQDAESVVVYSDVTPVKIVSFLRESCGSPCDEVLYRVEPMIIYQNSDDETVCTRPSEPTMEWVYIQLDKIPESCEESESSFEQWIRFMDLERNSEPFSGEGYAYTIEKDKFSDDGVQGAMKDMEEIVKKQFREYQKSVEDEKADAMLEAGRRKELVEARDKAEARAKAAKAKEKAARAKEKAARAKARAERTRANRLGKKVAALKRQLHDATVASQPKRFKPSTDTQ